MKATTEQAPGVRWQDLLLGLGFLAAGWANAPASLRVYAAHQRTAGGVFLLLCESGLLAGSAAVLLFTLAYSDDGDRHSGNAPISIPGQRRSLREQRVLSSKLPFLLSFLLFASSLLHGRNLHRRSPER